MKRNKLLLGSLMGVAGTIGAVAPLVTLTSCGNKTSDTTKIQDTQAYINESNDVLAEHGACSTCYEAYEVLTNNSHPISDNYLAEGNFTYDIDANQMIVMVDGEAKYKPDGYKLNTNKQKLWRFVDTYDSSCEYAQFFTDDFYFDQGSAGSELVISGSVDVGNVTNIKYLYLGGYESNATIPSNVTIRTNGEYLICNAPDTNVTHYGTANNVFVRYANSFTENGIAINFKAHTDTAIAYDFSNTISIDLLELVKDSNSTCLASFTNSNATSTTHAIYDYIDPFSKLSGDNWGTKCTLQIITEIPETWVANTIYRISDSVETITHKGTIKITSSAALDLNGKNLEIVDDNTSTEEIGLTLFDQVYVDPEKSNTGAVAKAAIHITTGNLYVFDSNENMTNDWGQIIIENGSIVVEGQSDSSSTCNFTLNSGEISTSFDANAKKHTKYDSCWCGSIFVLGNTSETDAGESTRTSKHAQATIYGGKINSTGCITQGSTSGSDNGIYIMGKGAIANAEYGEIYSEYGSCIASTGLLQGSDINVTIKGGTYTSDNRGSVTLYLPNESNLSITGGMFTGGSCIEAKGGTGVINGGTFISTGDYYSPSTSSTSTDANGSAFIFEKNTGYKTKLDYTFDNCTVYSLMADVATFSTNWPEETTTELVKHSVNFSSGTYVYAEYAVEYQAAVEGSHVSAEDVFDVERNGTWYKM